MAVLDHDALIDVSNDLGLVLGRALAERRGHRDDRRRGALEGEDVGVSRRGELGQAAVESEPLAVILGSLDLLPLVALAETTEACPDPAALSAQVLARKVPDPPQLVTHRGHKLGRGRVVCQMVDDGGLDDLCSDVR
ncbi:MAG TPA: hypothetical protein VI687_03090 [Candidatus Limnocylindrales bacterium]|nr:hypothetical protein [Candidatus Limnocylindrales bacterium]